jgi:hypothetical protein
VDSVGLGVDGTHGGQIVTRTNSLPGVSGDEFQGQAGVPQPFAQILPSIFYPPSATLPLSKAAGPR